MLNFPSPLSGIRSPFGARLDGFNPAVLFGLTDTGWFYDHSDFSRLFQDAAGTIPVTAVGQPVGRQLDKSGKGNHRTQSTSLNRPTLARQPLGGIRSLLTFTEQFDNAAWGKLDATVTANAVVAPDGATTADRLVETALGGSAAHAINQTLSYVSGQSYTISIYLKKGVGATAPDWMQLTFGGAAFGTSQYANVNLTTGLVGTVVGGTAGIQSVGNGWYRVLFTATATSTASAPSGVIFNNNSDSSGRVPLYAGATTSDVYLWGAQLELGSTATAYQRVTTPFDVTEAGVPDLHYLSYDGINDSMATASFAWGTDKATVVAGVRKLSDAAGARTIVETSTDSDSTNGTFRLGTDAATFTWRSRGTVSANTSGVGAQPITAVLTGTGDIAGDVARLRRNAAQVGEVLTDQGTGNFLTYPAYFGARGGTSSFFNGREYSQFAINRLLTTDELAQIEAYTNSKTGAY